MQHEGMTHINHPLWLSLRELLGSFPTEQPVMPYHGFAQSQARNGKDEYLKQFERWGWLWNSDIDEEPGSQTPRRVRTSPTVPNGAMSRSRSLLFVVWIVLGLVVWGLEPWFWGVSKKVAHYSLQIANSIQAQGCMFCFFRAFSAWAWLSFSVPKFAVNPPFNCLGLWHSQEAMSQ